MITEDNREYKTLSPNLFEIKRIHQTPPPFSLLKTMIYAKVKKPQSDLMRMTSLQFSRNFLKRPETPLQIEGNLKVVGRSHPY